MNALRILFLLLAVSVLGLLGWRLSAPHPRVAETAPIAKLQAVPPSRPVPASPPVPHLTPEDQLAEVPEFAGFYAELKTAFPRDYAQLVEQIATRGTAPSGNAAIWDAMRDLQQSQGILAAHAGDTALDGYFTAREAVLDGLAPLNARDCADFLYGVVTPSIAAFTAAHRGLVATLADRQIAAIEDGRNRQAERTSPTDADLDALSTALAARQLTPGEIGLLIDGTTPDPPLADARLCDIGRIYLDVLHGLPSDMRQRIYGLAAELLARS